MRTIKNIYFKHVGCGFELRVNEDFFSYLTKEDVVNLIIEAKKALTEKAIRDIRDL